MASLQRSGVRVWSARFALVLLAGAAGLPLACKGGGESNNGGSGSGGDQQGGGSAGAGDGGGGGAAGADPGPMAGIGGEPVVEAPETGATIEKNGSFPVSVDFADAGVLAKNFKVFAADNVVSIDKGWVKIQKGRAAILAYDTTPDDKASVGYEGFTASIDFRASQTARVWFNFNGAENRTDAAEIGLLVNNGRIGAMGAADVDGFNLGSFCFIGAPRTLGGANCTTVEGSAYAATTVEPGERVFTVRITVKNGGAGQLNSYFEVLEGGQLIDHQKYAFTLQLRNVGEIAVGASSRLGDVFIDNFKIEAEHAIPDFGIKTVKKQVVDDLMVQTSYDVQLWLPEGVAKVKAILNTYPAFEVELFGKGDLAMFEHLRAFARAHEVALTSGAGLARADAYKAALDDLATMSNHPELATVPVFVESLINNMAREFAIKYPERTLGFVSNKLSNSAMNSAATPAFLKVPGVYIFSPTSVLANIASTRPLFDAGRMMGAPWALVAHGGQTHAVVDSWAYYLPFAASLLKLRLKADGGLNELAPSSGYEANFQALTRPGMTWPAAYAKAGATADATKSWVPDEDMAMVLSTFHYNQLGSMIDPVTKEPAQIPRPAWWVAMPRQAKQGDARMMTVAWDDTVITDWKKIEFFDGAAKKGEVLKGAAPEFAYTKLERGTHAFIARITAADDKVYGTFPAVVNAAP